MIKSYQKNGKTLYEVYVAERDKSKKIVARRKRGLTSERQAKEIEFQFKVELSGISSSATVWTWSRWHEECLRKMKFTLKNSTLLNYNCRVKKWVPSNWNNREITLITTNDVLEVLESIQNSEEPISQKYFVRLLRRLFEMAIEEGVIDKNPVSSIKIKENKVTQKVLNVKEAEHLLVKAKETNHRFYPIWAFALMTGMRSGEMYALKWTDIDLQSGLLKVTKQWTNKDGITPTKTGDSRVVPISSDFHKFLIELKLQNGANNEYVLPHLREWTNGEQASVIRNFCKAIGITEIKFHDLRATFITNLLAQGVPLVKVMSIVGHRKMATTDLYLRLAGVDIRGATDTMGYTLPTSSDAKIYQFAVKTK